MKLLVNAHDRSANRASESRKKRAMLARVVFNSRGAKEVVRERAESFCKQNS